MTLLTLALSADDALRARSQYCETGETNSSAASEIRLKLQAARDRVIQKMLAMKIIDHIELSSIQPKVSVAAGFHTLSREDQTRLMRIVASDYLTRGVRCRPLELVDSRTRKMTGTFSCHDQTLKLVASSDRVYSVGRETRRAA